MLIIPFLGVVWCTDYRYIFFLRERFFGTPCRFGKLSGIVSMTGIYDCVRFGTTVTSQVPVQEEDTPFDDGTSSIVCLTQIGNDPPVADRAYHHLKKIGGPILIKLPLSFGFK